MLKYHLEVDVQRPALKIETQPARIEMRQQRAMFKQKRQPAQMQIHRTDPTFTVDRSNSNRALNRMPILQQIKQFQDQSVQVGLEAIGRIAGEGNRLSRIYDRHQSVAAVVTDRLAASGNLNMVAVPKPVLNWEPGHFEIEWKQFEQELQWMTPQKVEIEVQPHQVTIELEHPPEIRIHFEVNGKHSSISKTTAVP